MEPSSACSTHLNSLLLLHKDRAKAIHKVQFGFKVPGVSELEFPEECVCSYKRAMHALADPYARAWNCGFAKNIVRSLPQELKDMIYLKLVLSDRTGLNKYGEQDRRQHESQSGSVRYKDLLTGIDYPHYFQTDYMGEDFVTELSKMFHHTKHFALQHPGELEGFLWTDRFGTECIPADFVLYISIDVSLNLLNADSGLCRPWSSPKFGIPLKQHFMAALRGLDALNLLAARQEPGNRHTLRLRVDCKAKDHGRKFAEVLVPLIYTLKSQGWVVEIKGRYARGQSHAELTARDFDYSLTRAEWSKRIQDNSAFMTDNLERSTKKALMAQHMRDSRN